jgi:hypothetical protein
MANKSKRLLVALAITALVIAVFAITTCTGSPAISAGAAAPKAAVQPAPPPPGAVDASTSESSIGSRIIAAAKTAEAAPHGDIGEPAVATAP